LPISCQITKDNRLDTVEGSIHSEMKKDTAYKAGACNVELPAPLLYVRIYIYIYIYIYI
jgi:hypothetical protein